MSHSDLLGIERLHHGRGKVGQLQPLGDVRWRLARLGGNLLDAVLRFLQVQQRFEALRFFHRVNIAALEVFNQLRLQHFGIGHVLDADGHGCGLSHPRGAVTPRSEDNLEADLISGTDKQRREDALAADGVGQFLQARLLEVTARVGGGL
jgi:hypothetical protein